MSAPSFEDGVRESGRIAFIRGVSRRECPLHPGSLARTHWQRGYDSAKRAAARHLKGASA